MFSDRVSRSQGHRGLWAPPGTVTCSLWSQETLDLGGWSLPLFTTGVSPGTQSVSGHLVKDTVTRGLGSLCSQGTGTRLPSSASKRVQTVKERQRAPQPAQAGAGAESGRHRPGTGLSSQAAARAARVGREAGTTGVAAGSPAPGVPGAAGDFTAEPGGPTTLLLEKADLAPWAVLGDRR